MVPILKNFEYKHIIGYLNPVTMEVIFNKPTFKEDIINIFGTVGYALLDYMVTDEGIMIKKIRIHCWSLSSNPK